MIRLGYACVNTILPSSNKTFRLDSYSDERMIETTKFNLLALGRILEWNKENDILVFRISSGLVPFGSASVNKGLWKKELKHNFSEVGELIKQLGIRVSMHPGQYTVINSPSLSIYDRSFADIQYHCDILDLMGLDNHAKVIIHGGGIYQDRDKSTQLLINRLKMFPQKIIERIALENDDRSFNAQEILSICKKCKIPGVFDVFHHEILPSTNLSNRDMILHFEETWQENQRQKIHYSNQNLHKRKGSHSDKVDIQKFMKLYDNIKDLDLDIMIETKDKEQSVLALKNVLNI